MRVQVCASCHAGTRVCKYTISVVLQILTQGYIAPEQGPVQKTPVQQISQSDNNNEDRNF